MEFAAQWITQYGYAGIFSLLVLGIVGLPVPDETLLTFAGYLVFRGDLHLVPTIGAAFLGSVCGITVSYALGRLTGYLLLERCGPKLHIKPERIGQVHEWFRRFGRLTLTFGYYVPGVRHLTAYVAGASRLEMPVFAGFAYTGAFLWSATFVTLGYALGDEWRRIAGQRHHWFLYAGAAAAVLALAYLVRRRHGA